jgi:hypothetical protein
MRCHFAGPATPTLFVQDLHVEPGGKAARRYLLNVTLSASKGAETAPRCGAPRVTVPRPRSGDDPREFVEIDVAAGDESLPLSRSRPAPKAPPPRRRRTRLP